MRLLIIRPQPGASASAARAKAAGFTPVILPFFEVQPVAWQCPNPADYDALLISSSNSIRHAGAQLDMLKHLPAHAVGQHSAKIAQDHGFAIATIGKSGIETVLADARTLGHQRLLWLAGKDRLDIATIDDMICDIRTVYASIACPLPDNAKETIASADIVALHSPRAARLFGETVDRLGLPRNQFCLAVFSTAIAEAAGQGWGGIALAKMPEDSALLSAAAELVKHRP
jgi:uroporphyrinogen-III synthase